MRSSHFIRPIVIGAFSVTFFSQAHALDIVISAGSGLSGNAPALAAFERAAAKWESAFTDNITVTISADMANLGGGGVIGSTGSVQLQAGFDTIRNQMVVDAADESSNSMVAFLPTFSQFTATGNAGASLTGNMVGTKANLKALGFTGLDAQFGLSDATMNFNTQFSFYYGTGTVPGGQMDFESVAVHEIGHALGFISSVDGGNSISPTTLDLFRFASNNLPTDTASFTTKPRALAKGQAASFNDLANTYSFSTGLAGDGNQASHWKADDITGNYIGIMDPTLDFGVREFITDADLRAFDLIGWDTARVVPEPASMIALGMGALALVRRKRNAKK